MTTKSVESVKTMETVKTMVKESPARKAEEKEMPKGKHTEVTVYTDQGTALKVVEIAGVGCCILNVGMFIPQTLIAYDRNAVAYIKQV